MIYFAVSILYSNATTVQSFITKPLPCNLQSLYEILFSFKKVIFAQTVVTYVHRTIVLMMLSTAKMTMALVICSHLKIRSPLKNCRDPQNMGPLK